MDDLANVAYAGVAISSIAIGLGVVLLVVQHATRSSISISLCYIFLGLAVLSGVPVWDQVDPHDPKWFERFQVVFEGGLLAASSSYLVGLLETSQAPPREDRRVRAMIKLGYVMAAVLVLLGVLMPAQRLNDYLLSIDEPGFFTSTGFWVFGSCYVAAGMVFTAAWILLARQRLDVGERARAVVAAAISPLLAGVTLLPLTPAVFVLGLILLIGTYGQFRYFVAQGERGAFLSRFLSSQVAESVRMDGLASVMQPGEREVTVVACDLRGFTAYAEAVPSQAVIDLLSEYYDAVGMAVAEVAGTVKDYAGDGVLILIGAPLPRDDHAPAGIALARRLHELVAPVRGHWGTGPHPLGLGVGVATGRVTVGAVGSSSRMEYTAVGTAVNLASRLCAAASDGETLVDQSTVDVTGVDGLSARGSMPIKGLTADHAVYALDPREDGSLSPAPGSTTS